MPNYPNDTVKYVVSGTINDGEIFEWGWLSHSSDIDDVGILQGNVSDTVVLMVADGLEDLLSIVRNDTTYERITAYKYTGGPAAAFAAQAPFPAGSVGTSAVFSGPLQTCMAITTGTDRIGASYRGRFYLPAHGQPLTDATHLFPVAKVQDIVDSLGTFFTNFNHAGDLAYVNEAQVISRTLGTGQLITSLSADLRPDIQRRRANQQPNGGRVTAGVGS